MNRDDGDPDSLVGLAKRWLRTQLTFTGDPHKSRQQHREAERLEGEMTDRVEGHLQRAAYETLVPPGWKQRLEELQRQQDEQQGAREERDRAEHAARPRATLELTLAGDASGSLSAEVPVVVSWPAAEGEPLIIELEPLEPLTVGVHQLLGLMLAVPGYHGPGSYDLDDLAAADPDLERWDPAWYQLWLDSVDEPYYWVPDYGAASVTVASDERTLHLQMPVENAGSQRVEVLATIVLP